MLQGPGQLTWCPDHLAWGHLLHCQLYCHILTVSVRTGSYRSLQVHPGAPCQQGRNSCTRDEVTGTTYFIIVHTASYQEQSDRP